MTEERLPKEAVVEVTLTVGSALGGEAEPLKLLFASLDAARDAAEDAAGRACSAASQLYGSSVRLQSMAGQARTPSLCLDIAGSFRLPKCSLKMQFWMRRKRESHSLLVHPHNPERPNEIPTADLIMPLGSTR